MRALKAVRQHHESYLLKSGVFHFYRGEHGPAAEYLTRALTESDEISAADRRSARYYLVQTRIGAATEFEERGELARAIEQYERALEVMPQYADVQHRLGLALLRVGRVDDAIRHFQFAVESNANFAEAQVQLGFSLIKSARYAEAARAFRAAQQAHAHTLEQRVAQAEQALDRGQTADATALYQDAFRANIAEFERAFSEGLRFLRGEKWEEAVEQLSAAAKLRPRFADVHNYLGVALAENEQIDQALASFRQSARVNPDYLVAWLNLAYTAFDCGDLATAREALAEIERREPDNPPALHLASKLMHAAGSSRK